jgi:phosphopantetheinyl transferase (holo-ACP synthase)
MIIGLGSDLCNIERIAHSLERFENRAIPGDMMRPLH